MEVPFVAKQATAEKRQRRERGSINPDDIIKGALELLKGRVTPDGRLAIYIVLATIPAVAFGIFLKEYGFTDLERNVAVVAWNTIL